MSTTAVMAIGDSHCRFFAGLEPTIVTYHLGAALAWSLASPVSRLSVRARVRLALGDLPTETWALLCFGEIDMRCHVLAPGKAGPIRAAERYFDAVLGMRPLHPKIAFWAPTATQPSSIPDDEDYPCAGTEQARNAVTRVFSDYLRETARPHGIPLISILDLMVDARGLTKPETLTDGRHASRALLPEALRRLNAALAI